MKRQAKVKLLVLTTIFFLIISSSTSSGIYTKRINMTYLYAGTTSLYINNVDRSNENIDIVCPDYFEIYENGDLKLLPKIDTEFVDAMHIRGIIVVPFLSNHWDRALGRKAVLRGEMAAFVNRSSAFEMTYPAKRDPSIPSPENIVAPR